MRRRQYPILEFDPALPALIEPQKELRPLDVSEHCVITFFGEVIEKLSNEGRLEELVSHRCEDKNRPLYEMRVGERRLAVMHSGVGAPLAAGLLEEVIARGCRKFIACGGCGVLDRQLAVGHLLVPVAAVRDEGTSYHYLPAGREVNAHPQAIAAIEQVLKQQGIDYLLTKTWTTDAPYRETPEKVKLRKKEGCLAVEMEAAAFFAVAQFRGVPFGHILYSGDDVSGSEWDGREWHDRWFIRERLFWLAAEACLQL